MAGNIRNDVAGIHELFAEQVAKTPEALAVFDATKKLTYGQLSASARSLAAKLQSLGVGPDDVVGVMLERSIHMFVCLLGSLFSGGAYVAIDPTYPAARIDFILGDAECKVLLTTKELSAASAVPGSFKGAVLLVDDPSEVETWPAPEALKPIPQLQHSHLFAMFYTSGTTGVPKVHQRIVHHTHGTVSVFL